MELSFNAPARLDDMLIATVTPGVLRSASFTVAQNLTCAPDVKLLLQAQVRIACLDAARFRPCPIPDYLLQEIAKT